MKQLCCVICGKYRKFEKPKTLYLLEKALVLSIICSNSKNEDKKVFKEEESIEILQTFWFNRKYIIALKIWQNKT